MSDLNFAKVERLQAKNILTSLSSGKALKTSDFDFLKKHLSGDEEFTNILDQPLTLEEFKDITGLTARRIQQLKSSEKVIKDYGKGKYYIKQIFQYIQYQAHLVEKRKIKPKAKKGDINPEFERARKDRAQADKLELEIAIKRDELVDAREIRTAYTDMVLEFKNKMMAIPARLAPVLEIEENAREIEAIIDKEVREALSGLARGE